MVEEPLLKHSNHNNKKGGFRTLPFILGNDAMENIATYGLMANMTLYLMNEYHVEMTTASNVLYFWSASTTFMPLIGAIIADSFLGRFYTIGFGSVTCFMGMILLWSTAIIPQARPLPCNESSHIRTPHTSSQFTFLCTALSIISIGIGGLRSSSLAFGADQLEKNGHFHGLSVVNERYFSCYYASYTISVLITMTCIAYIQDNMGWGVGFLVPALLILVDVSCFFLASPFYVRFNSKSSLVTGFIQVVVASFRNRQVELSDNTTNYTCLCKNGSNLVSPSRNLRFLNKACIVRDPHKDLTPDGMASNPWSHCTVDQVEELKALLRVIPIWSFRNIHVNKPRPKLFSSAPSRFNGQTNHFDFHHTSIPATSFSIFAVISVILWIVFYDRVFIPMASKIKGRQVRVSTTRMGLAIFLSLLVMISTPAIEGIRRSLATSGGSMSAIWLVPQNEFYFSELPRSMSSVASTLYGIGACLANVLASFLLNRIDDLSKTGGNRGWILNDINKGHYDYYYLVLAGLSVANMVYFLVCCQVYGPLKEERKMGEEEDGILGVG